MEGNLKLIRSGCVIQIAKCRQPMLVTSVTVADHNDLCMVDGVYSDLAAALDVEIPLEDITIIGYRPDIIESIRLMKGGDKDDQTK